MGSMDEFEARLRSLLFDESFMRFMQEEPYVYRGEGVVEVPERSGAPAEMLSAGISPELAADLVRFARRMRGMPLLSDAGAHGAASASPDTLPGGAPSSGSGAAFWVISPEMYRDLFDVVTRSSSTSLLWEQVRRYGSRDELRLLIADDLRAAARRDGIPVGDGALRELAMGTRLAADLGETLVSNALELFDDETVLDGSCDEAALREVWGRLVRGCDDLDDHPRMRITVDEMLPSPREFSSTISAVSERMERAGHCEVHPLMDLFFVSDIMFDDGPFERFNGMMEVVLRHAFVRRLGMPVLGHVPYSAIRLDWEMGVNPQLYNRPYGKAFEVGPYGNDSTLCLRESIAFMKRGLERLERAVADVRASDEQACARIIDDWRLNERQKAALCSLVNNPRESLDAAGYAACFDVVSSTAHADLAALARLGLVRVQEEGRRRVYRLTR